MTSPSRRTAAAAVPLLLAACSLISGGCQHRGLRREHCADFACGSVPAPAGTYRDQWHAEQTARADRDFFMFYLYEWQGDSEQLSPFGERHLRRAVERAAQTPHPLVIEPSGDAHLDQRRLQTIQTALLEHDVAWSDYPVVVGYSDAEPLYGFESPRVLRGYLGGGMGGGGMGGMGGGMGGMGGGGMGGGGMGGMGGMGGGGLGGGVF
jgi:hypothetical protein